MLKITTLGKWFVDFPHTTTQAFRKTYLKFMFSQKKKYKYCAKSFSLIHCLTFLVKI